MSFENIQWRAYFRANSENKVDLMIRKLEKIIGKNIIVKNSQKYWKDNSLYEVEFITLLGTNEVENAIFEVLKTSRLFTYDCHITGPDYYEGEKWSFEGLSNKTNLSGLEWISFRIQNYSD